MVARYSHQNGEHIHAAMDVLENAIKQPPKKKKKSFFDTIIQELHRPEETKKGFTANLL